MTTPDKDPLLDGLATLGVDAPDTLLDRFAARWTSLATPIGELRAAFTDHGIAFVRQATDDFGEQFRQRFARPLLPALSVPDGLEAALVTGDARGIEVDLRELGEFQESVLLAARTIPPGQVRPYAWIAAEIGRPKAVRAVGTALAKNPVPLVIPCHRVVRTDGGVGQYIFGAEAKQRLLRLEHADV